jgi:hypothetical protein
MRVAGGDGKVWVPEVGRRGKAASGQPARADPPAEPEPPSPFARILRGLAQEVDRGEATVRRTIAGRGGSSQLGNDELLALQAGVYRYSEAVDLSAKLVDRAANGVKTVLQGQ